MLRDDLYKPWFAGEKDWGFEIVDGEFSGVVVQIGYLKILEEAKEDGSNCDVDYNIINKPEDISDEDLKSEIFHKLFEMIITDIMEEAIRIYEEDRKNRTDDPKESSPQ